MRLVSGGTIKFKERRNGFKSKQQQLIWAFVNSGEPCAKVEGWKHKCAYVCRNSMQRTAKRMNLPQIYVLLHRENVYLINTQL